MVIEITEMVSSFLSVRQPLVILDHMLGLALCMITGWEPESIEFLL